MTDSEKKQPHSVFVNAGKLAFQILVPFSNNPYKEEPYRTLWEKGYRRVKRDWEIAKAASKRRELIEAGVLLPTPAIASTQRVSRTPAVPSRKPFRKPTGVRLPRREYRTGTIGSYLNQKRDGQ